MRGDTRSVVSLIISIMINIIILKLLFGPRREKTCLRGFANNTGADQRFAFWKEPYLSLLQANFIFF